MVRQPVFLAVLKDRAALFHLHTKIQFPKLLHSTTCMLVNLQLECPGFVNMKFCRILRSFAVEVEYISCVPVFCADLLCDWLSWTFSNHQTSAKMLVKVKTLTGKEIEIDIDPTDKVCGLLYCSNIFCECSFCTGDCLYLRGTFHCTVGVVIVN